MKSARWFLLAAILIAAGLFLWLKPRPASTGGSFYPHAVSEIHTLDLLIREKRFRIEVVDDAWRLTVPLRDLADVEVMKRMLATLHFEDADSLLPLPPRERWGEIGLDPPVLEVRLHREGAVDTIRFGDLLEGTGRLRVQAGWSDSLMLVSTILRSNFLKNRYHLSDKRVLPADSWLQVESLELSNEKGRFAILPGSPDWTLVAHDRYPADRDAVLQLLNHLANPVIVDFLDLDEETLDRLGLRYPRAVLKVNLRGRILPVTLALGFASGEHFFAWSPEREAVFLLDSLTCVPLLQPFPVYLSQRLFEIGAREILAVSGPGGRMERAGEKGLRWRDPSGRILVREETSALLILLENLSTTTVETLLPRSDQLVFWGLDPPEAVYEVETERGTFRLEVGCLREGRRAFRRPDFPPVYSLPADRLPLIWPRPETGSGD